MLHRRSLGVCSGCQHVYTATCGEHRPSRSRPMNPALTIMFFLLILSSVFAGDVDDRIAALQIDSGWTEIDLPAESKKENWSVRMFRHTERNELLTFACYSMLGPRSIDDAWEFAPSGYPYWFPQNKPYTINPIKGEWLDSTAFGERNRLAYTVVNEHESDRIEDLRMANGVRANVDDRVYYVQHTSSHPIADGHSREWLERLIKGKRSIK